MSRLRARAGVLVAALCVVLVPASVGWSAAESTGEPLDPTAGGKAAGLEGEELMIFEDMPVVVSASRQDQPTNWLSVPVSVITAEDIHYSGQTNIPEVLQFVPGVDVLRIGRNRYAVGVRGLHGYYSDRLLGLIDGRPANNPAFGGVEWTRLPILMEDIKSIEVVRGPGGAAWGANAYNGVVNIITKDPEDCLGLFVSTTWNHFGDPYNHIRYAEKRGKWSYRISLGYEHRTSSEDAIHDDEFTSRDFARNWKTDTKVVYRPSEATKLTMGSAYLHEEGGDYELYGWQPRSRCRYNIARQFVKLDHRFDTDTSGYLQWFSEYQDSTRPQLLDKTWCLTNDLEGQLNFSPARGHKVSVGGNLRWVDIYYRTNNANQVFMANSTVQEYWGGLFAIDRWQVTERLVLEGQIRGDCYSAVQADWSGRVAALYALDADKKHVVRLATAKAFRSPAFAIRDSYLRRNPLPSPPLPPGLFGLDVLQGDFVNEETWSIEAGYTGKLAEGVTVHVDPYYQRCERLIGAEHLTDSLSLGRVIQRLDNIDGADAYGVECELALTGKPGKLSLWYAYNDFVTDRGSQAVRAFFPATHKAGLTGRLHLPDGWTLNAGYRYTDVTEGDSTILYDAPKSHRLDFALAKELFEGRGEVMIGVNDVLNTTDREVYDTGATTAHETPGRTFFLRVQISL